MTAVLILTGPGCGDGATPCSDCPALEGRYRMEFAGDAGVGGDCSNLGVDLPRGRPLDISRTGDRLSGTLEGLSLAGTVSAQGSFSLSGLAAGAPDGGRSDSLSLAGLYTPPVGDGGTARLTGTYTGTFSRAGNPQRCNLVSPFSATRE
ncbi:hypothetical protein ACLESO_11575 [Pyxidicoccus sp. 3LG]